MKEENDEKQNEGRDEGEDKEKYLFFVASKGWFDNLRKQNLHYFKFVSEIASADEEAAPEFVKSFKIFIENPEQILNAYETGLFWERCAFISMEGKAAPGFKIAKVRLTLLFCTNASDDYKYKPLLIYYEFSNMLIQLAFQSTEKRIKNHGWQHVWRLAHQHLVPSSENSF